MPADNQLGAHGGMWSHCFPEGIVNAASLNHLWFQCLGHDADLQINSNGSKLIQNWNCPIFFKVMFLYIHYQIENMNRKGIMWAKASEGTAMPCGFTRHWQNHHQSAIMWNNLSIDLRITAFSCRLDPQILNEICLWLCCCNGWHE